MSAHVGSGNLLTQHSPIDAGAKLFAANLAGCRTLDGGAILGRHLARVEPVVDVAGFDCPADCNGQRALRLQHADSSFKGFFGSHGRAQKTRMFVLWGTNSLAASPGKIICMETLGELVKRWRTGSGLTQPDLAKLVGVAYQNIQQLENGQAKQPRYIAALAKAMGSSVDDLLALRMPRLLPINGVPAPPPTPRPGFSDNPEFSDSDRATLEAVKMLLPEEKLEELRQQAAQAKRVIYEQMKRGPAPSATTTRGGRGQARGMSHFGDLGEPEIAPPKKGSK